MNVQRQFIGLIATATATAFLLACNSTTSARQTAAEATGPKKGGDMSFTLHSSQWKPGQNIPAEFTCDGKDVSPPLEWSAPPAGTQSLSLLLEDPDAPGGTFIHWVLYDLPAGMRELPGSVPPQADLPSGARQGRNSFGRIGYGGPCPPPGPAHRYYFHLYALNRKTDLAAGASRADLERAMRGHILEQAEYMGRYQKRR